jgi:hypothetical protein
MEQRTYHIRKTIDIVVSAPWDELQDDTERWVSQNIVPDCLIKYEDDHHIINDVRLVNDDEDQDSFVVVSWPESQDLCEYENYTDYCTFIMGDELPCCSYLVNKEWYSKLLNKELRRVEELEPIEY